MSKKYSISKKKQLGAYYTPKFLANYLARTVISLKEEYSDSIYSIVDPATGESSLLESFTDIATEHQIPHTVLGIDIEKSAVKTSQEIFNLRRCENNFIVADGLYPVKGLSSLDGWNKIKSKYLPNGIDFILSNPPWGVETNSYHSLQNDFNTAVGQFDIYDLFIELCIRILKNNGCYGFIVPDTIYNQEHTKIRKILIEETTITHIIRLGEGFFPGVNMATTLIIGIKQKNENYYIKCSHIPTHIKKSILTQRDEIGKAIENCSLSIPVVRMIESGYRFITDERREDSLLMQQLNNCSRVREWCTIRRGAELSKKGIIVLCDACNKWFPKPRTSKSHVKCPHCKQTTSIIKSECIISSKNSTDDKKGIIVGEDIQRYHTLSKAQITLGYSGINYKSEDEYNGSKILVRKTGVGITAGIDYTNCITNQVVYILKRYTECNPLITNEVILAILNSRITTYYIIKEIGSNGWKTHAYMSQSDVEGLPFPIINFDDIETCTRLNKITGLVKQLLSASTKQFNEIDAKIEKEVASLFNLDDTDYIVIFDALNEVQKMIPFKRLLNITTRQIFK